MVADTPNPFLAQARVLVASNRHAAREVRREASETPCPWLPHRYAPHAGAARIVATPALYHQKLERRLQRAIGRLSALRDVQVYAARFGASSTIVLPRVTVPLFSSLLAR